MTAMTAWIYLLGAITLEVCATTSLKFSNGFSDWRFTVLSLTLYGLSFWVLALTLRVMPISTAYAVWSGLGTAVVAVIGILVFKEPASALKALFLVMIIGGVVGLNAISGRH
ncbi:multidrug efflux SMR transporter [Thalassospira sp.]|uniref:DMT family transporter n=1 Tax=Thalassospira sp. TaxID=1912094 RepID=UPI00273557B5|nr:multidrug efflux SMR transporter [Thalassospira sp.]MDP2697049.1 multidrug efflux SMR transporter [Thalassospira sp.]